MPAGSGGLPLAQRERIDRAVRQAERSSRLFFLVWIGEPDLAEDLRGHARALLTARGAEAPRTVVVAVDPAGREVEVVTGTDARRVLDDRSCSLAVLTMTSCFSGGDLVGGVVQGLAALADHARRPAVLHVDQP